MAKSKINKVTYSKSGKGNTTAKLSVPAKWLEEIGVYNEQNKNYIIVEVDEENRQIILKAIESEK